MERKRLEEEFAHDMQERAAQEKPQDSIAHELHFGAVERKFKDIVHG